MDGTERSHHLVAAEPTEELERILARASEGADVDSLAAALTGDRVMRPDAEAYVAELIDSQVLVPDLAVPVTGDEPLDVLIEELGRRAPTAAAAITPL